MSKYRIISDGEVISQDSESLRSDGKWEKTPELLVGMIFDKKNNPDWYFRVEEDEDEM